MSIVQNPLSPVLIATLFFLAGFQIHGAQNSTELHDFMSTFVHENSHCVFVVFFDNPKNPTFNQIYKSISSNSGGIYAFKKSESTSYDNSAFITKAKNFGKTRPACTLGVVYITRKPSDTYLSTFFRLLQLSHGLIKTNQDGFFFVSENKVIMDTVLFSKGFGEKIKFSIGITLSQHQKDYSTPQIKIWFQGAYCNKYISKSLDLSNFNIANLFGTDRRMNLCGKLLTISTPTSTRWLNEMHTVNGKWIPRRGIYSIALDQLMRQYNFTSEFIPSTGGGTGAKVNSTHWVGTVGDVLNGKADIGHVTAFTFSRSVVADLTFPITYEWLTFTTGKTKEYHSWKKIYWPLTPLIWQLTALSCICVGILFKVILKLTNQNSDLLKIIEYMLAVVTEEGVRTPEQHPTHSLRGTIVIWLLFSLLMGTAYRSKLTVLLAFPIVDVLPESFEELAASKYSIGLQYIKGAAYQILKSSENPTYVNIFKRMELEESDVRCFKRSISSHFACISWDSIANYVYHKNLTDKFGNAPVVKSPASTCFTTAGLVLEKRSILKESFDYFLIRAMDSGMMNKWQHLDHEFVLQQRKLWEKETNQPELDHTPPVNEALTLAHLIGGNYLFCVGVLLSFIAFLLERIYHVYSVRYKSTRRGSKDNQMNFIDTSKIRIPLYYGFV